MALPEFQNQYLIAMRGSHLLHVLLEANKCLYLVNTRAAASKHFKKEQTSPFSEPCHHSPFSQSFIASPKFLPIDGTVLPHFEWHPEKSKLVINLIYV